jgi:hypothetical protein
MCCQFSKKSKLYSFSKTLAARVAPFHSNAGTDMLSPRVALRNSFAGAPINSLPTLQRTESVSIMKTYLLILFREVVGIYC